MKIQNPSFNNVNLNILERNVKCSDRQIEMLNYLEMFSKLSNPKHHPNSGKRNSVLECLGGEAMTLHSSVLALRIPGTGEPCGLPSMGLHRVGHDWSDLAAAAAECLGQQRDQSGECCHYHSSLTKRREKVKVKSLSRVGLFVTPWMVVPQAPLFTEFSRQEYWNG